MKLFKHYKNKPYKYLGVVKHSETLEELVLYQCRYDNPNGLIWVRPKDMFFENVTVGGLTQSRFEKKNFEFKNFENITEKEISLIAPIIKEVFGEWDPRWFHSIFKDHTSFYLQIAFIDQAAVAFKLGYEIDHLNFYSWLGGVLNNYRDLGLASELMEQQHTWCLDKKYRKIQTQTLNKFQDMLILNLKHKFEIVGTHLTEKSEVKIRLEKDITHKS